MIKDLQQSNISLSDGIHRTPTIGDAGELSECVNLIPKAGELVTIPLPKEMDAPLAYGDKILCIHKVQGRTNYIFRDAEFSLFYRSRLNNGEWIKENGTYTTFTIDTTPLFSEQTEAYRDEYEVGVLGNMLVVTGSKFGYILWDDTKKGYHTLGYEIPKLDLMFGLHGEIKRGKGDSIITIRKNSDKSRFTTLVDSVTQIPWGSAQSDPDVPGAWGHGTIYKRVDFTLSDITLDSGNSYLFVFSNMPRDSIAQLFYQNVELSKVDYLEFEYESENHRQTQYIYLRNLRQGISSLKVRIRNWISASNTGTIDILRRGSDSFALDVADDEETLNAINANCTSFLTERYKEGEFVYPFFVRYALRMYDGSVYQVSEPILMTPNTGVVPRLYFHFDDNNEEADVYTKSGAVGARLFYLLDDNTKEEIKQLKANWSQIVKSLVIYVSPPIYTYNQSGVIGDKEERRARVIKTQYTNYSFVYDREDLARLNKSGAYNLTDAGELGGEYNGYAPYETFIDRVFAEVDDNIMYSLLPPTFNQEEIHDKFVSTHDYYKVIEIPLKKWTM